MVPGATRERSLRMVGGLAIPAGAIMWIARPHRSGRRARVGAGTQVQTGACANCSQIVTQRLRTAAVLSWAASR
jgi:hypothetical protein